MMRCEAHVSHSRTHVNTHTRSIQNKRRRKCDSRERTAANVNGTNTHRGALRTRTYRHAHTHTCARTSQPTSGGPTSCDTRRFHSIHACTVAHTNRVFFLFFFFLCFVRSYIRLVSSVNTNIVATKIHSSLSPYTQYAYIHTSLFCAALIFILFYKFFLQKQKNLFIFVVCLAIVLQRQ